MTNVATGPEWQLLSTAPAVHDFFSFFFSGILRPANQKSPIPEIHYVNPLNMKFCSEWFSGQTAYNKDILERHVIFGGLWEQALFFIFLFSLSWSLIPACS